MKTSHLLRENIIWDSLIYLGHFWYFNWVWPKLSHATVTVISLNSQDMISQVNVYSMNILWILCDAYVQSSKTKMAYSFREILNISPHKKLWGDVWRKYDQ